MDRQAHNPCYTCRNRRIQCDQSGVPCGKCQKAGLECLDKRPFKWVKGVAIRGNLQGHVYESANPSSNKGNDKITGFAIPKRALMRTSARRNARFDSPGNITVGVGVGPAQYLNYFSDAGLQEPRPAAILHRPHQAPH